MEVQKNQKPQNCETCEQCDYEIEYADRSSSLGVLVRDTLHLVTANGSITDLDIVFGYFSQQTPSASQTVGQFICLIFLPMWV